MTNATASAQYVIAMSGQQRWYEFAMNARSAIIRINVLSAAERKVIRSHSSQVRMLTMSLGYL